jgi:hypothetical protein
MWQGYDRCGDNRFRSRISLPARNGNAASRPALGIWDTELEAAS